MEICFVILVISLLCCLLTATAIWNIQTECNICFENSVYYQKLIIYLQLLQQKKMLKGILFLNALYFIFSKNV